MPSIKKKPRYKWMETCPIFKKIWLETEKATRKQWAKAAEGSDSTYAITAAIFKIINSQANCVPRIMLQDPTLPVVNFLFIEWRMPGKQFIWPFGTKEMPVAVSGEAASGHAISNMDFDNGKFPEELLGKKWQK